MIRNTMRAGLLAGIAMASLFTGSVAQEPAAEGIQVHGHWIIEIYDQGELVDRYQFDNDLTTTGAAWLVRALSGETPVVDHAITVVGSTLCGSTFGDVVTLVTAQHTGDTGSCRFQTLSVTTNYDTSSPESIDNNTITLAGSFTAGTDGQINAVTTLLSDTLDSVSAFEDEFTYRALSSAISVDAGQQVSVTVVISFG